VSYLVWRALRSLSPGWHYFLSVPVWLSELATVAMGHIFVASLWCQIERPARVLSSMMEEEHFPAVDM
jgi:hypothetical protein